MDYPYKLTMRFSTLGEMQDFIYYWLNNGGENMARLTTVCDPTNPSWQGDSPELLCKRNLYDEDAYGAMDSYTHPFSTDFAKPE